MVLLTDQIEENSMSNNLAASDQGVTTLSFTFRLSGSRAKASVQAIATKVSLFYTWGIVHCVHM